MKFLLLVHSSFATQSAPSSGGIDVESLSSAAPGNVNDTSDSDRANPGWESSVSDKTATCETTII